MTASPKSPLQTSHHRQLGRWTGPLAKGKGTTVTALRRSLPRTSRVQAQPAEGARVPISLLTGRRMARTASLTPPPLASRRPPWTRRRRTEASRRRKSREVVAALPTPGTIRSRGPQMHSKNMHQGPLTADGREGARALQQASQEVERTQRNYAGLQHIHERLQHFLERSVGKTSLPTLAYALELQGKRVVLLSQHTLLCDRRLQAAKAEDAYL